MTEIEAKKFNAQRAKWLCERNGCTEKKAKIHFDQIVHRAWNPHPSHEFVSWWQTQPEFRENGVDAVRARNCKVFTERYKADVEVGLANFPTDYPE
jgi:hypothetical protein